MIGMETSGAYSIDMFNSWYANSLRTIGINIGQITSQKIK